MTRSKLSLIISHEYKTEISTKSFWISTIVTPIIFVLFSFLMGMLVSDSDTLQKMANPTAPDQEGLTGWQIFGMMAGLLLALFLMMYGAQIFNKVRKEKVNRIIEVLATSVTGRIMMLGKIISVFLIGMTQLAVWVLLFLSIGGLLMTMVLPSISFDILKDPQLYISIVWIILYFLGGYLFYGSLYAACGALTDKDNENQGYMTLITILLLVSFYLEQYAVDNGDSLMVIICNFIPFTAPAVGTVGAITGDTPVWISVLSVICLYLFAFGSIAISGKIYTSSLLLKGRKLSPKDILIFLKSK